MTHGFDLEDALHDRLRGPVPATTLAWVDEQTGRQVVNARALEGGRAAALHRLSFDDGGEDLVVRRYVLDWVEDEPWAPSNEATVLDLLAGTPVPAPALVAADPDGQATGTPTVLMTAVDGQLVWRPDDVDAWLDALVSMVVTVQQTPVVDGLREWEPYAPEGVPAGTAYHWAWERAEAAFHEERPSTERAFLHRDYHPGNVLWKGERISAVVDWTAACIGPPEEDVAHCRLNLALNHGQAVAEEFLDRWLRATGRSVYHPGWDLLDAVSWGSAPANPRLDAFVATAARRCGS